MATLTTNIDVQDYEVDIDLPSFWTVQAFRDSEEVEELLAEFTTRELADYLVTTGDDRHLLNFIKENYPDRYRELQPSVEYNELELKAVAQAAFILETVAHLRGLEHEMLPTADQLRLIVNSPKNAPKDQI